jgi:hypothetical protein
MILAGIFAGLLFLILVISDWLHFTRIADASSAYGCPVAKGHDTITVDATRPWRERFDTSGQLQLPHGLARWHGEQQRIVLRPSYHLFSMRFRTAWPLKGTIEVRPDGDQLHFTNSKRMPWSSAIITAVWFAIVTVGTISFLTTYSLDGGFTTFGGLMMGLGMTALSLLILLFGLMIFSLAYRLEDQRLKMIYQELRDLLAP